MTIEGCLLELHEELKARLDFKNQTMVFLPAAAPHRIDDITTGKGKKHPK